MRDFVRPFSPDIIKLLYRDCKGRCCIQFFPSQEVICLQKFCKKCKIMTTLWYKINKFRTVRLEIVCPFIYPAFKKLRYQTWTLYQFYILSQVFFVVLSPFISSADQLAIPSSLFPFSLSSVTTFLFEVHFLLGLHCFAPYFFSYDGEANSSFNVLFHKKNKLLVAWNLIEQASLQRHSSFLVGCK